MVIKKSPGKVVFASLCLFVLTCKDPVQEKCSNVCNFFIECTETIRKQKIATPLKHKAIKNCMTGCGKYQTQILLCHEEAKNSCTGMIECLKDSGLAD